MRQRAQNSTSYPLQFLLVLSIDHITGATGKTPTVTLSKSAAGYGAAAGAVTEVGNGVYSLAGNATDRNTLGELWAHITATGCDTVDLLLCDIVTVDVFAANQGLTNVTADVAKWNGTTVSTPATAGIPDINVKNVGGSTSQGAAGYVGTDQSKISSPTATVDLSGTTIKNVDNAIATVTTVTNDVGITQAAADKVWNSAARTLTSFGTLVADVAAAVWASATRILTAGTNIVLAKGVGLTGLNDISATQVNDEVVDALTVDTYAEPSAPPAATSSIKDMLNWVKTLGRNKLTETATTQTVFADDGTTPIATATVSDDGTTAVRSKMS